MIVQSYTYGNTTNFILKFFTIFVLSYESLLFHVLHSIPSSVDKLNITMGSPVKNTAFYAFLEILFNMYINRAKYKKESFYYKDLIDLIEHPYFIRICCNDCFG